MIFIGIDPGKGGGVCYVNTEPDRDSDWSFTSEDGNALLGVS